MSAARAIGEVLLIFLVTRLVVFLALYFGAASFAPPADSNSSELSQPIQDALARWDTGWYLGIASDGYHVRVDEFGSDAAFFPLYPILIVLVGDILGDQTFAAVVVSNISFLIALWMLRQLVIFELDDPSTARRTLFYLCAFPTSYIFIQGYSESLYLALCISTFYLARRGWWGLAAITGFLTAATRIVGVVVWGVALLEWLRLHGWRLHRIHRSESWRALGSALRRDFVSLAFICAIPLGLLSYIVYQAQYLGDPFLFVRVQAVYGRRFGNPLAYLAADLAHIWNSNWLLGEPDLETMLNAITFALMIALAFFAWRKLGASYGLYSLAVVIVPASSSLISMSRFVLAAFPIFIVLAIWGRNDLVDRLLLFAFCVLLGLVAVLIVNGIFIA